MGLQRIFLRLSRVRVGVVDFPRLWFSFPCEDEVKESIVERSACRETSMAHNALAGGESVGEGLLESGSWTQGSKVKRSEMWR